ncbi:Mobile element protein [Richelia intracellularis]|nr:Mobile element protein [Richelia intracellularis]
MVSNPNSSRTYATPFNAKADYVLALKGNNLTLYGQVKNWFE